MNEIKETETKTSVLMAKLDELSVLLGQIDNRLGDLIGHEGCENEDTADQPAILNKIEYQIDDMLVVARRSRNKVNEIC